MERIDRTRQGARLGAFVYLMFLAVATSSAAGAAVHHVPGDFPTIQQAIAAAGNGDEIVVAPGTYAEAINTLAKAIHLRSAAGPDVTVIDATGLNASVVTVDSGEGRGTVIEGFTITGGAGTDIGFRVGGGMYVADSDPIVLNCVLRGNTADNGGAIAVFDFSHPLIVNSLFVDNTATQGGGATTHFVGSDPTYINCTFSNNSASFGGAVMIATFCQPVLVNCILWGNGQEEISGFPTVRDSIVQGGYEPGTNIMDKDPLFADPGGGDFRLTAESPAIDAGDTDAVPPGVKTDLDGNPRIVDGTGDGKSVVDFGAFEFQACAPADLNCDGLVDVLDLLILLDAWGECGDCNDCVADFDGDCAVDVLDLLFLLDNWG
jgi:hypothetical protein